MIKPEIIETKLAAVNSQTLMMYTNRCSRQHRGRNRFYVDVRTSLITRMWLDRNIVGNSVDCRLMLGWNGLRASRACGIATGLWQLAINHPLLLGPLQTVQIGEERLDLRRTENEYRHIGMAGDNALGQRFGKISRLG